MYFLNCVANKDMFKLNWIELELKQNELNWNWIERFWIRFELELNWTENSWILLELELNWIERNELIRALFAALSRVSQLFASFVRRFHAAYGRSDLAHVLLLWSACENEVSRIRIGRRRCAISVRRVFPVGARRIIMSHVTIRMRHVINNFHIWAWKAGKIPFN